MNFGLARLIVELVLDFAVLQQRSREPMIPLHLLRRRSFAAPQIAVFAIAASFFAVFLYTTLYLQTVLGLSAIETGLVYLPASVVYLPSEPELITMLHVAGFPDARRIALSGGIAQLMIGTRA